MTLCSAGGFLTLDKCAPSDSRPVPVGHHVREIDLAEALGMNNGEAYGFMAEIYDRQGEKVWTTTTAAQLLSHRANSILSSTGFTLNSL